MTQDLARHYTIDGVAKICGVPRPTVDRWHRDWPDFPRKILIIPGCARFRLADIDAWLESLEADIDG